MLEPEDSKKEKPWPLPGAWRTLRATAAVSRKGGNWRMREEEEKGGSSRADEMALSVQ